MGSSVESLMLLSSYLGIISLLSLSSPSSSMRASSSSSLTVGRQPSSSPGAQTPSSAFSPSSTRGRRQRIVLSNGVPLHRYLKEPARKIAAIITQLDGQQSKEPPQSFFLNLLNELHDAKSLDMRIVTKCVSNYYFSEALNQATAPVWTLSRGTRVSREELGEAWAEELKSAFMKSFAHLSKDSLMPYLQLLHESLQRWFEVFTDEERTEGEREALRVHLSVLRYIRTLLPSQLPPRFMRQYFGEDVKTPAETSAAISFLQSLKKSEFIRSFQFSPFSSCSSKSVILADQSPAREICSPDGSRFLSGFDSPACPPCLEECIIPVTISDFLRKEMVDRPTDQDLKAEHDFIVDLTKRKLGLNAPNLLAFDTNLGTFFLKHRFANVNLLLESSAWTFKKVADEEKDAWLRKVPLFLEVESLSEMSSQFSRRVKISKEALEGIQKYMKTVQDELSNVIRKTSSGSDKVQKTASLKSDSSRSSGFEDYVGKVISEGVCVSPEESPLSLCSYSSMNSLKSLAYESASTASLLHRGESVDLSASELQPLPEEGSSGEVELELQQNEEVSEPSDDEPVQIPPSPVASTPASVRRFRTLTTLTDMSYSPLETAVDAEQQTLGHFLSSLHEFKRFDFAGTRPQNLGKLGLLTWIEDLSAAAGLPREQQRREWGGVDGGLLQLPPLPLSSHLKKHFFILCSLLMHFADIEEALTPGGGVGIPCELHEN